MKNVIKELLLMRKCMTNDYYISVKNKTNCFLNSCKKHKATKQVSFIFSISRVHLSYCVICTYIHCICILHLGISDSLLVIGNEWEGVRSIKAVRVCVCVCVCVVSIGSCSLPSTLIGPSRLWLNPELASFRVHIQFLNGS